MRTYTKLALLLIACLTATQGMTDEPCKKVMHTIRENEVIKIDGRCKDQKDTRKILPDIVVKSMMVGVGKRTFYDRSYDSSMILINVGLTNIGYPKRKGLYSVSYYLNGKFAFSDRSYLYFNDVNASQTVEIGGWKSGVNYLKVVINPNKHVKEQNRKNNVEVFKVIIDRTNFELDKYRFKRLTSRQVTNLNWRYPKDRILLLRELDFIVNEVCSFRVTGRFNHTGNHNITARTLFCYYSKNGPCPTGWKALTRNRCERVLLHKHKGWNIVMRMKSSNNENKRW